MKRGQFISEPEAGLRHQARDRFKKVIKYFGIGVPDLLDKMFPGSSARRAQYEQIFYGNRALHSPPNDDIEKISTAIAGLMAGSRSTQEKKKQIIDYVVDGINPNWPGFEPVGPQYPDLGKGPANQLAPTEDGMLSIPLSIHRENPRPIRIGDLCLYEVFRVIGNDIEPLNLLIQYNKAELSLPPKIKALYDALAQQASTNADKGGYNYFPDGPCARLLRIIPNSRQSKSGLEEHRYILELGPVSWEQYTVLNELLLSHDVLKEEFANVQALYDNGYDFRWCKLSNLFTITMVPITSDGYGLVGPRSQHAVSSAFKVLVPSVNENIHRFLDEAAPTDLERRLHPVDRDQVASDCIWKPTEPVGVPSPLLTAQRGVFEELSPKLYNMLCENPNAYKFLNVMFSFDYFHPYLTGVIELNMSRAEVKRMIEESPPAHPEHLKTEFLALDTANKTTLARISDRPKWGTWGLAAFMSAMRYWEHKRG